MSGVIQWLRPSEEAMTRLWQYVCESYCTVWLPSEAVTTAHEWRYQRPWPMPPNFLRPFALWLRRRGHLQGSNDILPWYWTWSWDAPPWREPWA